MTELEKIIKKNCAGTNFRKKLFKLYYFRKETYSEYAVRIILKISAERELIFYRIFPFGIKKDVYEDNQRFDFRDSTLTNFYRSISFANLNI